MKRSEVFLLILFSMFFLLFTPPAHALVDLVTLPKRDSVQITIYNSADLTLVKEERVLSLEKGINNLEFSWVNTLIDPTSIFFKSKDPGVELVNLSYPPRIQGTAIWNIKSEQTKPSPVEISYFTSGLSWESYYIGTLNIKETTLNLEGYVRVRNNSGEDYENAQTRLIVGKVHLLERISELARKLAPYGDPRSGLLVGNGRMEEMECMMDEVKQMKGRAKSVFARAEMPAPKKIIKEGLSEYFLYTIEGTETVKNSWAKRLPSFKQDSVPVKNLFKYDSQRYGNYVQRFLYFKNDKKHKLGETPLPGGRIKIFQTLDKEEHLKYLGEDNSKYIPIAQEVELNLGPTVGVSVKPKRMNTRTLDFVFNHSGNIWGYTDEEEWTIETKNFREIPSRVQIRKHLKHQYWKIKMKTKGLTYKKINLNTIEFTLDMKPGSSQNISYIIKYQEGKNRE